MRVAAAILAIVMLSPPAFAQDALDQQVTAIFEASCAKCHGPAGVRRYERAKGGFDYVLDLERLANNRKLIARGNPAGSKLFSLVVRDEMPDGARAYAEDPLTAPEKAVIRDWIAALPVVENLFVSDDEIDAAIARDLAALPADARDGARYLTLTHLANAGATPEAMAVYRQGVAKLVNSLSWQPELYQPVAVDDDGTILRISLPALGWSAKLWDRLARTDLNRINELTAVAYNAGLTDAQGDGPATPAGRVKLAPRTAFAWWRKAPIVRALKADWFAFVATRPDVYHDILDLPYTLGGLERRLGVDRDGNISSGNAVRAAVAQSGVSLNNRLLERHATKYGAYWLSYDFAGGRDNQDLLSHPLDFRYDGGEVIFNLPNGLQGYMLVTDEGFRIDAGPLAIVQDSRDPDDATVLNGISCMACHGNGMNPATDSARDYAVAAGTFDADELARIEALYPPDATFQTLLTADSRRFAIALRGAGVDVSARSAAGAEPVSALVKSFLAPLDSARAAAELGVLPAEITPALVARGFGDLAARAEGPGLPRTLFLERFATLIAAIAPSRAQPVLATALPPDYDSADEANAAREADEAFRLASLYLSGSAGVPQDLSAALTWLDRAAAAGHDMAQGQADVLRRILDLRGGS